jgi:PAS domain S-box-containing protein
MSWHLSLYIAVSFSTALLSNIVSYMALRQRDKPGGLPLGLLMLAVAEWSFSAGIEVLSETIPAKVFWSKVGYLGTTTAPVFLFWFAWEFAQQERRLNPRHLFLLLLVPLITFGLAVTNEWHQLIWTSFTPIPDTNLIIYGHGLWFWVLVAYTYSLLCIAAFLLIRAAFRFRHLHRLQFVVILTSFVPPWLVNVIYVFDLLPGLDLTPASFALNGLMLAWSFYRLHLLDLIPVARDKVVEDMRDGVVVLDAQDRIVDVNPAAQRLIGLNARSLVGQPADAVLAGRLGLDNRCWDVQAAQSEILSGGDRYLECRTFPLQERRFVGRLIILRDVTERERAQEALQELNATLEAQVAARTAEMRAEKERSDAILRSVSDGILMTDRGMRILYANPAFASLTGHAVEDVFGHHVSLVTAGTSVEKLQQAIGLALVEAGSWHNEVTARRKDGRLFDAALTAAPVRDAEGRLEGYVFTLQNISQRKDLERARGRFLDNVSHQFRTPVTTLGLYAYLIQREDVPEAVRDYLKAMQDQIAWLTELVQDVVEMTTLDSGAGVTEWELVSVPTVIADTLAHYQERARAAGLSLAAAPLPSSLPAVRGDQARLTQALKEVVENAVVFTPSGGYVTLQAEAVEGDGQTWVAMSVRDTGPGIPLQEQDRVFDRFFRGSLVDPGHIRGTGLGLCIVQEIIRAHGGHVTVESGETGSTFTLRLPAAE